MHKLIFAGKGIVSKLSYKAKVPLVIITDLRQNSFKVQSYDNNPSAKNRYTNTWLSSSSSYIPLSYKIDQRYLNRTHTPVVKFSSDP